jgi:transposase
VEPTNNLAERQIRHGVMWRKTSFGTDSEAGSRFVERILTVVMSLRSQGRRILDFLVQSLRAVAGDAERPSLLPAVALAHATSP